MNGIKIAVILIVGSCPPTQSKDLSPLDKLIHSAEKCLAQNERDPSCLELHRCETQHFIDAYGPMDGAGRGWCNGSNKSFWSSLLLRANERFRSCLETKEEAIKRFDILTGFDQEKRAFESFRKAKCDLIMDTNWPYTPFAFEMGVQCQIISNRDRIVELNARTQECGAN